MAEYEGIIDAASLDEVCDPRQGDCESVAAALHRVFDADAFVCVYEPGERAYATHATAKIDGDLYDGTGRVEREDLLEYLGAFRARDVAGVESREEMFELFREQQIFDLPADPSILKTDPEVVDRVASRLETARD